MQATIATFDPAGRTGTVLLNDGTQLSFDAAAFDAGELLTARFGQRVNVQVIGTGRERTVAALTLATFSFPQGSHPQRG